MEGARVFTPDNWEASGLAPTSYAAEDLKKSLEGLPDWLVTYLVIFRVKALLRDYNFANDYACIPQ